MLKKCFAISSLILTLPILSCGLQEEKEAASPCVYVKNSSCGPTKATVLRVRDGDTIVLDNENQDGVRFLLVDTRESVNINPGDKTCYGKEASDFTKSKIKEGDTVYLEYEENCTTDKYGRLLAYVCINNELINRTLIEEGYAEYYPYDNKSYKYGEEFEGLQNSARVAKKGLWGVCSDF